jgi:DNA mismatch endonuclease (patch repair protein)
MMAGIKGKDTLPEVSLRKALYSRGYRYRLYTKDIPGKPDLVLRKYHAVIFVNGCFWHGHDCSLFKWPKTRPEFWRTKIEGNRERDIRLLKECRAMGLRTLVVWECAMKGKGRLDFEELIIQVIEWLDSTQEEGDIRGTL